MHILFRILFSLLVWTWSLASVAQNNSSSATTNSQTVANQFHCPANDKLVKDPDKMTWNAPGGWKSFNESFVNEVGNFLGAQWRGTNVGQITCVYQGKIKTNFPVLLYFQTLTHIPTGGKWGKNLGGYRNCISNEQKDCPFQIRVKPSDTDILEEAKQLKKNNPSEQIPDY